MWLKACAPGVAAEVPLLAALARWEVPHAVLPSATSGAFAALPDAGRPLRSLGPDVGAWVRVLQEHAALQRRLAPHADDVVALGVPDLRPGRLPELLDALLSRLPAPPDVDVRRFAEDCARLADGPVPATVQHDDLHDGNVVVDGAGAARVLDWGDAAVAHPFSVLLVTLRSVAALDAADVLRDAYLEPWTDLAAPVELRELAAAAVRVGPLGRALAWERALQGTADHEWGDPVAGWLGVLAGEEG